MADYIQFTTSDEHTLLVEVTEDEVSSSKGIQKAGLREIVNKQIAVAQNSLQEAIQYAIGSNANAFIQSVSTLPVLPNEAEMTFSLNMIGEVGNIAVGKVGGEANYIIKLTWKRETKE